MTATSGRRRKRVQGAGVTGGTIIPAAAVSKERRICVVGGDAEHPDGRELPTIVLERDAEGSIAKIKVRCTCGQQAELICGYESPGSTA